MFFFFQDQIYIAIIGDIVHSKALCNRNQCQKKLMSVLDAINQKYEQGIASKFMITLGDEFQGLLKNGADVMRIISEIEIKMYPVEFRFGIGIGSITTEIDPQMPLGADGPAYYQARTVIEKIKVNEKKNKTYDCNIMISSENEEADTLLNTILSLCTTVRNKWTDRQREIAFDCMEYGDNQVKAAERLGISQSSVQKSLANSGYYTYKSALDSVSIVLAEIKEEQDV